MDYGVGSIEDFKLDKGLTACHTPLSSTQDTGSYAEDSIPSEDDLESISSSDDSGSNHTPSPPSRERGASHHTPSPPPARSRASNHTPSPPPATRSRNHSPSPLRSKVSNNSPSLSSRGASNSRKTYPEPEMKANTDKTTRKPAKTTLLKTIMCSPPKPLKPSPTTSSLQSASNLQITITNQLPNGTTSDSLGPAEGPSHDGKEEGELDGSDSSDQLETGEVAALRSMLLNSIRKKKDNVPSPPPPELVPPVVEQQLEEPQLGM
eukprot:sb/3468359/